MTLKEIKNMIDSIGLPSVYRAWPENRAPKLPYICYQLPNSDNFNADDTVFQQIEVLSIELYSREKSPETEKKVEDVLNASGIPWEKSEIYIKSEHMMEVLYEMEVIYNNGDE